MVEGRTAMSGHWMFPKWDKYTSCAYRKLRVAYTQLTLLFL